MSPHPTLECSDEHSMWEEETGLKCVVVNFIIIEIETSNRHQSSFHNKYCTHSGAQPRPIHTPLCGSSGGSSPTHQHARYRTIKFNTPRAGWRRESSAHVTTTTLQLPLPISIISDLIRISTLCAPQKDHNIHGESIVFRFPADITSSLMDKS